MNKFYFSRLEIRDLAISALVITAIFAYPFIWSPYLPVIFGLYLLFIGLGFTLHETAHKFMAIHLGAVSEFRMWGKGLAFALIMRVIGGPIFIAPGATYWAKRFATVEDNGKVSAAGPVANIVLALLFLVIALAVSPLRALFIMGAEINLYLALFNLIPFPPLDGSKIMSWSPIIWGGMFGLTLLLRFFIGGL